MQGKRGVIVFVIFLFLSSIVFASELKITDIDAYVNNDKDFSVDEDGGKIDNVAPNSEIKLKIRIDNLFDDEIDIDEVHVEATIFDIDNKDNLYEDVSDFDLDSDEHENINIVFDIPYEVEEGDYELKIKASGSDELGNYQSDEVSLDLEIEKPNHDVVFDNPRLSPSELSCYRELNFQSKIINLGEKFEQDVVLIIKNEELGVYKRKIFDLDDDAFDTESSFYATLPITINSKKTGTYSLTAQLYYDDQREMKQISLPLKLNNCSLFTTPQPLPQKKVTSKIVYGNNLVNTFISIPDYNARAVILSLIIIFIDFLLLLLILGIVAKKSKNRIEDY